MPNKLRGFFAGIRAAWDELAAENTASRKLQQERHNVQLLRESLEISMDAVRFGQETMREQDAHIATQQEQLEKAFKRLVMAQQTLVEIAILAADGLREHDKRRAKGMVNEFYAANFAEIQSRAEDAAKQLKGAEK